MRATSLLCSVASLGLLALATQPASAQFVRIYQTNSGGDDVNVIDPVTNKTVGKLEGIEAAHGVAASPDGSRVYVTNESESTVDVFDAKTNKLIQKVKLSGHPNNLAVAKDGRIVVAIARDPGAMEIIDTAPPNKILIKLDFMKPFEAHNIAEFTIQPQGDATNVTWAMHGPVPLMGKVMHMVMDMDKMIGTDFAAGLEKMKTAAEK